MTTYNNVFNGNFVQPSSVSYRNIVLNADVELTWPTTYLDDAANNVASQVMTVQANGGVATTINLPNNPVSTVLNSNIVTITGPFNSTILDGTVVTVAGSADVATILAAQINIATPNTAVNANAFSYPTLGIANATVAAGGGAAVTVTYNLYNSITLPNATQVANGQSVTFINNGNNPFYIYDNAGNFLVAIPTSNLNPRTGNVFNIFLMDNTTAGGTWEVIQNGAGTTAVVASTLSGLGLTTIGGTLNTNYPSKTLAGDYTANLADRSSLLIWTGGVGTINLPSVNVPTPAGYYLSVNNNGTGVASVATTDGSTIDNLATFPINPGGSSTFVFNSPNWNSIGFGQPTTFQVNVLNLNVAAGGTFNLTNQQASRLIQNYTGALAGNVIITYPAAAGQWYVFNNTTNAFTLTVRLFGIGGTIIIPQGEKVIIYSDGTTVFQTPTTATNAIFNPGVVGAPTIVFTNSATTGFYSFGAGDFGFSSAATLSLNLAGYGLGVKAAGKVRFYNTANTQYVSLGVVPALGATTEFLLPGADATVANQVLVSNAARQLSFTTASYPNATNVNQILYSSATNVITGLASAINGVLVTSNVGAPSIGNTIPNAVQNNITALGTIATGVWNGTPVTVPFGGTGRNTLTTAFGTLCAGTTATNPIQTVATGTAGQVLTSNGVAALPTYQNLPLVTLGRFNNMANANPTILHNRNIAGIVRNAMGDYTVTFTTAYVTTFPVINFTAGTNITPYIAVAKAGASNNQAGCFVYNTATGLAADPTELNLSVQGT